MLQEICPALDVVAGRIRVMPSFHGLVQDVENYVYAPASKSATLNVRVWWVFL